jgi:xylan 1,4-beta-xylosidase
VGVIHILVTNFQLPRHPVSEETVTITVKHIPAVSRAFVERIDATHANATAEWQKMGSPDTLHPRDVEALEFVSALVQEPISFRIENDTVFVYIDIPPQGAALITLIIP